jgi:hypothetical protein
MFLLIRRYLAIAGSVALLAGCGAQSSLPASTPAQLFAIAPHTTKLVTKPAKLDFTTSPKLRLKVTEKGYTGPFKFALDPTGIVKIKPAKGKGPSLDVEVIAVSAGKAKLTVTDENGNDKIVPVTVTQGVIIIQ